MRLLPPDEVLWQALKMQIPIMDSISNFVILGRVRNARVMILILFILVVFRSNERHINVKK